MTDTWIATIVHGLLTGMAWAPHALNHPVPVTAETAPRLDAVAVGHCQRP